MAGLLTTALVGVATMITGIAVVSTTGGSGVRPVGGPAPAAHVAAAAQVVTRRASSVVMQAQVGAARTQVAAPRVSAGVAGTGWTWPLPAERPTVLRAFRVGPQNWSPGHRGVDLAAQVGGRVVSAGPGRVGFVGVIAGRGVVTVEHVGGLRTTYEPVTASVATGDAVVAGQSIGTMQATESHCGAQVCLHWGLRNEVRYFDPLLLLRQPHPVLLPDPSLA